MLKIVFVAFDCKKDNSILYKKVDIKIASNDIELKWLGSKYQREICRILDNAIDKGADFCSIRFIKEEEGK